MLTRRMVLIILLTAITEKILHCTWHQNFTGKQLTKSECLESSKSMKRKGTSLEGNGGLVASVNRYELQPFVQFQGGSGRAKGVRPYTNLTRGILLGSLPVA